MKRPTGSAVAKPGSPRQLAQMSELTRRAAHATSRSSRVADAARELSFLEWVMRGHFLADREPVNFGIWRYLTQIYQAVPADPTGLDLVIMKSAQGGASTMAMLFALWISLRERSQTAYFLPTEALARIFSSTRFIRLIRDNQEMHRLMGDQQDPKRRRVTNEGSAGIRQILNSILHFTYIEGRVTTEALPLDALVFDEVQEMLLADMERALERMSASPLRAVLRLSTANFPGADIDYFFQDSDQREFFTRCHCPEGVVLADHFDPKHGPLCIDRGNGSTPGVPREPFYVCPRCHMIILDPQDGTFRPRNPGARRIGFHFAQVLSPRLSPANILEKWDSRVNVQNFFNRILGRPYADPSTVPVTLAHLQAAQNCDLRWGVPPRRTVDGVVMGIDQMGGENYVVIKARVEGWMRVVHLEIIQSGDPWRRCAELMRGYRVKTAVVENLPNFNEAHRFAHEHAGRVYIATYHNSADEMLRWSDRPRDAPGVRHTHDDVRNPWTVTIDQFKMMHWSLARWAHGEVETPDARLLSQSLRTKQGTETVQVCQDIFWLHLQRVALVTEPVPGREDEHIYRSAVRKLAIDPHFAFANMLADVAWARAYGTSQILFTPGASEPIPRRPPSPYQQQLEDAAPWLFSKPDPTLNCGNCINFEPERCVCSTRRLTVKPTDLSCEAYVPELEDFDDE